ncbi:CMT1A duplicated region transcript 4 protein isoform X2 [Tupaia chinensis]|uniref:CMT1A duplicated region transcript 4 protein isoform X2 n=1 Tax=Tupaia chinensis TaxID=246437 RepID=UPI0003C8E2CF|nr:CMT1A duplicated region transcript 4 protein isoform X2 [Tupaia chinensis]
MGTHRTVPGVRICDMKKAAKMRERTDARRLKTDEGLTENIGLPLKLLENHEPWPAYVTYTSSVVKKLIEKSKTRDLECMRALEESLRVARQSKPPGVIQLKRRKSSGEAMIKDKLSETTLAKWGAYSVSATGPTVFPEPIHLQTDSRESPTTNYNKIIFSRKPMRLLPYNSLLANKEKHSNI